MIFAAVALTGCGARFDVYAYATENGYANEVHIIVNKEVVHALNESSQKAYPDYDYITGLNAWTLEDYIYFLMVSETTGLMYQSVSVEESDSEYIYKYVKEFADSKESDVNNLYAVPDVLSTTTTNGFIYHRVKTRENPFNGLAAAYEESTDADSIIGKIKNGMGYYVEEAEGERYYYHLFPSIYTAFPIARQYNLSDIVLNYVEVGYARRGCNGMEIPINSQNSYYVFSRNFDNQDHNVIYDYNTVNSVGWYLVALLVGFLVFAFIMWFTHTKKMKTNLVDRFPYNPEKFKDINSHLPK